MFPMCFLVFQVHCLVAHVSYYLWVKVTLCRPCRWVTQLYQAARAVEPPASPRRFTSSTCAWATPRNRERNLRWDCCKEEHSRWRPPASYTRSVEVFKTNIGATSVMTAFTPFNSKLEIKQRLQDTFLTTLPYCMALKSSREAPCRGVRRDSLSASMTELGFSLQLVESISNTCSWLAQY